MRIAVLGSLACLFAASCSQREAEVAGALDAFKRFQAALLRGDRDAVRQMVTRESAQVVPHLPLDAAADKQPLQVVRARRSGYRVHVDVSDPNDGGAVSRFIVAKERGRWVLDLLETTEFNHTLIESGDYTIKPQSLSPAEIERIRSQHPDVIR